MLLSKGYYKLFNQSRILAEKENSARIPTEIKTEKLPKLMISKYYGDPDKYFDFMNQYENAIHINLSLRDMHKFNYLKSLLGRIAANAVPTRIKCARVQMKIRDILDKDEVIIEALEIDEVTSAPLEFAPIDIINELKPKELIYVMLIPVL
ncbi:hypothetical protein NPIL_584021 [Nephila pilipes]|uniref:Uncharacterized protein n=1 Tax=Nephila pilipes TaxID=299642 RepID=A0A8X6R610_NEPPI|nr:hypothetical protein NPIL_584021 [Nephila pilipes]